MTETFETIRYTADVVCIRYVTAAYLVTVPDDTTAHAGDDAAAVRWIPLDNARDLAFDHTDIVTTARYRQNSPF
jgi:8-oxo-dGTP diphosphatase